MLIPVAEENGEVFVISGGEKHTISFINEAGEKISIHTELEAKNFSRECDLIRIRTKPAQTISISQYLGAAGTNYIQALNDLGFSLRNRENWFRPLSHKLRFNLVKPMVKEEYQNLSTKIFILARDIFDSELCTHLDLNAKAQSAAMVIRGTINRCYGLDWNLRNSAAYFLTNDIGTYRRCVQVAVMRMRKPPTDSIDTPIEISEIEFENHLREYLANLGFAKLP
ncbi:MAG: hypothetical protein PHW50_01390 [Patescibacteria group bacterium]|nr:hypothetical protein [Patescibacteria group bacterium]